MISFFIDGSIKASTLHHFSQLRDNFFFGRTGIVFHVFPPLSIPVMTGFRMDSSFSNVLLSRNYLYILLDIKTFFTKPGFKLFGEQVMTVRRNLSIGLRHLVRKITEPPPGSRPEPDWVG